VVLCVLKNALFYQTIGNPLTEKEKFNVFFLIRPWIYFCLGYIINQTF
jgi:hypothetical protein